MPEPPSGGKPLEDLGKRQAVPPGLPEQQRPVISSGDWNRFLRLRWQFRLVAEDWRLAFKALAVERRNLERLGEMLGTDFASTLVRNSEQFTNNHQEALWDLEELIEREENAILQALRAGGTIEDGGRINLNLMEGNRDA